MFFVYAIRSEKDGRVYVGMCGEIEVRLREHNSGKTKSTKGFRSCKLIYTEAAVNRIEARKREIYLKSGVGKEFLKLLVP